MQHAIAKISVTDIKGKFLGVEAQHLLIQGWSDNNVLIWKILMKIPEEFNKLKLQISLSQILGVEPRHILFDAHKIYIRKLTA